MPSGDLLRTAEGVLLHLQVSEAATICLLTGGFYQAAFLFQGVFFHPPHFHSVCSTLCSLSVMKRRLSLWIGKFFLKYSSCVSLQLLRSLLNTLFLVTLMIFPCPAATPALYDSSHSAETDLINFWWILAWLLSLCTNCEIVYMLLRRMCCESMHISDR